MNYIISIVLLLVFDAIYLKSSSGHFDKVVKSIQGSHLKLRLIPAIACYLVLAFAINYFIIKDKRSVIDAFLLGFVIYATFDLTNMAIFNKWDFRTSLMDMTWGGVLFASVTYLTYLISE